MRKKKKILIFILVLLVFPTVTLKTTIKVNKKELYSQNNNKVSTRELAMLAAMAYEDVPNDDNYEYGTSKDDWGLTISKSTNAKLGCKINLDGSVSAKASDGKCIFREEGTAWKNGGEVNRYIEGISKTRLDSAGLLSKLKKEENGQSYYWLKYADISEISNWQIVHMKQEKTKSKSILSTEFSALTFQKGNNYVIAFRGTDFDDLIEWLADGATTLKGINSETKFAYNYAIDEYNRIIKSNSNSQIYVVGHSLGGYLAEVGGAAIINNQNGISETKSEDYTSFADLENKYKNGAKNLVQVISFNGMGTTGINHTISDNKTKALVDNINNALVYLSTHNNDGTESTSNRNVNYSESLKSSGRLVLYTTVGDIASLLGMHFGEIYELELGADSLMNHYEIQKSKLDVISGNFMKNEDGYEMTESIIKNILAFAKPFKNDTNLPTIVNTELKNNDGIDKTGGYGGVSLFDNLGTVLRYVNEVYNPKGIEIAGLLEDFKMTHETDNFVCLQDEDNGRINEKNISITFSGNNIKCNENNCYTNKSYNIKDNDDSYELGKIYENYEGNYIIATANVTGGCAKVYHWVIDGESVETLSNKIIIPTKYFSSKMKPNGSSESGPEIKVSVIYGDKLLEKKMKTKSESGLIMFENGETINKTQTVETKPISSKVTLHYDTVAPSCKFSETSLTIEKGTYETLNIKCDDDSPVTPIEEDYVKVKINNDKTLFRWNDGFRVRSIKNYTSKVNGEFTISIQAKENDTLGFIVNAATLTATVKDYAGNKATVKGNVKLERINKVDAGK